ncbi:zinc finger AN1 domain-containing stress-associated protein 12 [Ricinus communis]|uniref:Arsenite inducuble RNA associated protein aip-1, putative n=1 Tax=Ricinus communis TaxID=3988 RepID=B9RUF8_RICCO|nr:zinc finger AN1 domain-containing stress-associated protein 12 [Ricinus communis]XP_015573729.1 zinc finger AN1 domain-containing stress-associated protein 12 [Ricinus communis]EEF44945.1 arsenite inducuble RNA associated protein aip-1, putative [Ricinus communis]|eukprot:XP_002517403.1 zinc finger AN1 domain-containing stress-associated protein 12 [Ricinus communis]
MAAGGTEAFPDLGKHCQHSECNQLDFLPFQCNRCQKVFCLEHRSYKSHECTKPDQNSRKVVVCEICSSSIETTGRNEDDEKLILEKHVSSGDCDPKKKKKPTCGARRCKEVLTFSNTCICKTCHLKVCLKHRFPADHECNKASSAGAAAAGGGGRRSNDKFLVAWASRNGKDCAKNAKPSSSKPSIFSVKIF